MKISEVIQKLQEILNQHGDIPVLARDTQEVHDDLEAESFRVVTSDHHPAELHVG